MNGNEINIHNDKHHNGDYDPLKAINKKEVKPKLNDRNINPVQMVIETKNRPKESRNTNTKLIASVKMKIVFVFPWSRTFGGLPPLREGCSMSHT